MPTLLPEVQRPVVDVPAQKPTETFNKELIVDIIRKATEGRWVGMLSGGNNRYCALGVIGRRYGIESQGMEGDTGYIDSPIYHEIGRRAGLSLPLMLRISCTNDNLSLDKTWDDVADKLETAI
jgi:hypothetical protein